MLKVDFRIKEYKLLLSALQIQGYSFQTYADFIQSPKLKTIILRHDVDKLPLNSLHFSRIQAEMGIKGSYYFRSVPQSWDDNIIKEIADLGHEVGYHYETMDTSGGDVDKAWDEFKHHIAELRKLVDVKTICMHGSPYSKFDNKDIWKKYNYRSLDIIGEPYFDISFESMFYLTDTGRRWDGWKTSLRDKVSQQEKWVKEGLVFHSTNDIIKAVSDNNFPEQVMFTFHPQRWHDKKIPWLKELLIQNIKNQIKKTLILYKSNQSLS